MSSPSLQTSISSTGDIESVEAECSGLNPTTSETEAQSVPIDFDTVMSTLRSASVGVQVQPDRKNARVQARPKYFSVG